jgi:hypothetical protein
MTILLTSQQILNRFKKFPRVGCVAVDGDVTAGCIEDVEIYFSVRCDVLLNCGPLMAAYISKYPTPRFLSCVKPSKSMADFMWFARAAVC